MWELLGVKNMHGGGGNKDKDGRIVINEKDRGKIFMEETHGKDLDCGK